jgi:transposase InsO family protein
MRLHANARTCPNSRRLLVDRIEHVSERSARKWLARWRADGEAGLADRSSAPRHRPSRLPADRIEAIEKLRRVRMTGAEIAEILGIAISTVSRWLKRIGLGRLGVLEPPDPPNRYERRRAGELVHLDVKKLGRISRRGAGHRVTGKRGSTIVRRTENGKQRKATGWEFVHVCVDDATRLAYAEVLPNEKGATAAGFLRRAAQWFGSLGITVERVMSDNGACYRARVHAKTCQELGARPIFIRPYRPRTNGKAERFIQTLTRRWAYGAIYGSSKERAAALPGWLDYYNYKRSHGSLAKRTPAARLAELEQRHG